MKKILIFAGTTEGRKLSEYLADAKIAHTICVATEYGEIVLENHPLVEVHKGRMNQDEMKEFMQNESFAAVVDATHPYAELVTKNIRTAAAEVGLNYLRLKRETAVTKEQAGRVCFETNEACAKALEKVEGNILLTTGSKELAAYCVSKEVKERLYVRVLPGMESLELCQKQGICGKHIIAMQGPFSVELNEALIHQYKISCLVTKESGVSGGFQEKITAAERAGITVFSVGHKEEENGASFETVCRELEDICGQKIHKHEKMSITLAGIGMGSKNNLTKEVIEAIETADILLGAERMLSEYKPRIEKKPYYQAGQIIPYLQEIQQKNQLMESRKVVILFSGDSGFYSGCQLLYHALQKEIAEERLDASLCILPGISSVSYLAACIGESYHNAVICSMHGKELQNLAHRIKKQEKTFLLMSGVEDVRKLGKILIEAGLAECEITVGYQLSYPMQQIKKLTPKECCEQVEEGLYTCFIKNEAAVPERLTHGIVDAEFIRDKTPMTKEEVREVSICKLHLKKGAVVYDIGSGTGSIAVEIAGISDDIKVYAIEQKKEAVELIKKNAQKFLLENIVVTETTAPEGMSELPVPTHAFIGGSNGRMREILDDLYQKNPNMRIVINAVSLETICEIKEILSEYPVTEEEVVQLQTSRTRKAGRYHLMQAENPVFICAFYFCREDEK